MLRPINPNLFFENKLVLFIHRYSREHCRQLDCTATEKSFFFKYTLRPDDRTDSNKDSKTKGGLVGFTLNKGAVHRWILGQSERCAISRNCQEMANITDVERYNLIFHIACLCVHIKNLKF